MYLRQVSSGVDAFVECIHVEFYIDTFYMYPGAWLGILHAKENIEYIENG